MGQFSKTGMELLDGNCEKATHFEVGDPQVTDGLFFFCRYVNELHLTRLKGLKEALTHFTVHPLMSILSCDI